MQHITEEVHTLGNHESLISVLVYFFASLQHDQSVIVKGKLVLSQN